MRYFSLVVSLLLSSTVVNADRYAVRPLDAVATDILARAVEASEVVRSLVATIESSNVIAHVETARQMPGEIAGMMRFVTSRGGYRYLRITIAVELSRDERIAILAHELKHACEVAESDAGDVNSLRRLFGSEGHIAGEYFDTRAAVRVEQTVRRELKGLQAEPVVKFHH